MSEAVQGRVKASEIDLKFKHEIAKMPGGEKLMRCFQCGTCTSDCPIARFSDTYRPRRIIRMAHLGLKQKILNDAETEKPNNALWLCASCFTCTDRCPQDVEVASVIRILKNLAAEQGIVPQAFKELGSSILETGYAYRISELRIKKREALGLPPLPKAVPESLDKTLHGISFLEFIEKREK
jgi:heterodisulfide reductase subunit C